MRNTPGQKHKPKLVHAYITAEVIHASARNIEKVKSGVSLQCARSIRLVHKSHYSRLEKPTIPLPTQERLPRMPILRTYHYAYARHAQVNWKKETKKREEDEGKKRKRKRRRKRKKKKAKKENEENKRREKQEKTRGSTERNTEKTLY